jgi:hypothetical protein
MGALDKGHGISPMTDQPLPIQNHPFALVFATMQGYPGKFMGTVDRPKASRAHGR